MKKLSELLELWFDLENHEPVQPGQKIDFIYIYIKKKKKKRKRELSVVWGVEPEISPSLTIQD